MEFRQMTFEAMAGDANLPALIADYAQGARYKSFDKQVDLDMYKSLYGAGVLDITGVFDEGCLVGFFTIILTRIPHAKGQKIASADSLFLAPRCRKGVAGVRLIKAIRQRAKDLGADTLFIATGTDTKADRLLSHLGMERLSTMWAERL